MAKKTKKLSERAAAMLVAKSWLATGNFHEGDQPGDVQIDGVTTSDGDTWVNVRICVSQLDIEMAQDGSYSKESE